MRISTRRIGRAARVLAVAAALIVVGVAPSGADPATGDLHGKTLRTFAAFDADQAVAVDANYFYSVDNYSITKHDRKTGKAVLQWYGGEGGPIIHLDSAMVLGDTLYAAHSNYPSFPMASSIEMWNTKTMKHIGSYSFGIYRGSLTWIDRHDGAWWATFANYNEVRPGASQAYGLTANTQLVRMNDDFQVTASWTYPDDLLQEFDPMSNSGGSWGPDGRLYITGHDAAAAYVMELPAAGSVLRRVATIDLPDISGQGIAWDRSHSGAPTLWGLTRDSHHIVQMQIPLQHGEPAEPTVGKVLEPGHFIKP